MASDESNEWVLSVCGLNCAKCDILFAGRGDEKLLNEILEWFSKERGLTLKPEQVCCEGCRGNVERHWSSDCKMMLCAKEKGVKYCFECGEFPCKVLDEFSNDGVAHHKRTVENLKRMKAVGVEAWIKEQKRKGKSVFCP